MRSRLIFYLLLLPILALTWSCQGTEKDTSELFYEYGPPTSIWLTQAERDLLAEQAESLDTDVRDEIIKNADQALKIDPNPTDSIFYEGLVSNHPKRLGMRPHFRDITSLAYLVNAFVLTRESAYAEKTIALMVAWAKKYRPTGNDVNENKLRDFYYAFDIHRTTFSSADRTLVEGWLNQIALEQIRNWDIEIGSSNRHAKRMKLILTAGIIFDNEKYVELAMDEIDKILDSSMYADGRSRDLERRDALHYHHSQIKNYIILNYLTRLEGIDIYSEIQPGGGSVKKSMHYMFPYIRQEKVHPEWVNSKIDLDRRRYEAGDEYYKPGKPWDLRQAYSSLILASPFDSECRQLIPLLEQEEGLEDLRWLKFQVEVVKEISGKID